MFYNKYFIILCFNKLKCQTEKFSTMQKTKSWLAIAGSLMVILGILCIVNPTETLLDTAWLIGLVALCTGVIRILFALKSREYMPNAGSRIFSGSLLIIVGILFLVNTVLASKTLVIVFALWLLAESILITIQSFDYKKAGYNAWKLIMAFGLAGIVLGIAGLFSPLSTGSAFTVIIGFGIVALGVAYLCALFGVKKFEKYVGNKK